MKVNTKELLEDLQDRTQKAKALAIVFNKLESSSLQYKSTPDSWSVLECVAHLNCYYAFYIPLLKQALTTHKQEKEKAIFNSGILGQFFVKLMEPQKNKIRKMKAIARMNPNGSDLGIEVLAEFIDYQNEMLLLLEQSQYCNLNRPQIPTVMSKWMTISLGDTLRFIVAHNERHLLQAQNCLKSTVAIP